MGNYGSYNQNNNVLIPEYSIDDNTDDNFVDDNVQESKDFIDLIKKYGVPFPDCFCWTLDITRTLEMIDPNNYCCIFTLNHKDYWVEMEIYLTRINVNNTYIYKADNNMKIYIFKRDEIKPIYQVTSPLTALHETLDIIDFGIYNDPISHKNIAFLYKSNKVVEDLSANYKKFVNDAERWVRWAIKYEEVVDNEMHVD